MVRLAACVLVVASVGFASAQTGPQLLTVFPPGAKAGQTVEVTFGGNGFDGDEALLFSDKRIKSEPAGKVAVEPKAKTPAPKMAAGQAAASVKFKVTVPTDAGGGIGDVRVVTKSGVSNPRAFAVGTAAEVNEAEPNNDVPQAQKIQLNTTVNGVVSAPTDVDYVSFSAKGGQAVVVACLCSSIDSRLQAEVVAFGPDGRQLAANRGYRGGDAVLTFVPPADGEYVVRLSQFAYTTGGADHFYRLTVQTTAWLDAAFPPVKKLPTAALESTRPLPPSAAAIDAAEHQPGAADGNLLLAAANPVVLDNEKNTTPDAAQVVTLPCDIAGRVAKKNERHWYAFDAKKGDVWTLEVFADRIGSPVDAFFVLTDDKGKVIVEADDNPEVLSPNQFYTRSEDPARYRFNVPADGRYRVMVSTREAGIQWGVRDQYVLRIAKLNPDFRLAVMPVTPHVPEGVVLPKGGGAMVSVFVFRQDGFDGSITLSAKNLPPGVTCPPQVIGPQQTRGTLVFATAKNAADWAGFVTVVGSAKIGDGREHEARPFSVTWSPPGLQLNQPPPNTPMLSRMDRGGGLALAIRGTAPFALVPAKTEFKAKPGDKFDLPLKLTRDEKFKDGVTLYRGSGFEAKQATPLGSIAADKADATVSIDVPNNMPPGTHTVVIRGQAGAAMAKGPQGRPLPSYAAVPITLVVEGKEVPKKK